MNAALGFAAGTVARYGARTGFRSIMRSARTRVRTGGRMPGRKRKSRPNLFSRQSNKRQKTYGAAPVRTITSILNDLNKTHKFTTNWGTFGLNRIMEVRNPVDSIIKGDNHWERTGPVIHIQKLVYYYSTTWTGLFDGGHCILHMMVLVENREGAVSARFFLPNGNSDVPISYAGIASADAAGDDVRERSQLNTREFKVLAHRKVKICPPEIQQTTYTRYNTGKLVVNLKNMKLRYTSAAAAAPYTSSEMYPRLKFVVYVTAPDTSGTPTSTQCQCRIIQHCYYVP